MIIEKIYIGGWFQRTTLHMTEMWDFLKSGKIAFDAQGTEILSKDVRAALDLVTVTRESGVLEYVLAKTSSGIDFRIYEDGLIVLEKKLNTLAKDCSMLKEYYDGALSKAVSFVFSKGAPVPKELANIQTILPYIVTVHGGSDIEIKKLFADIGETVYAETKTSSVEVYRGSGLIVINNLKDEALARAVIESQIFFREFKTQLHRYLAIHRTVWEKIQKIKEGKTIKGTNIDALRSELSMYQKTITLIGARIDQMPAYVKTRQKMTDLQNIDPSLEPLFQFKFETLLDTHEYIQHLWGMTKNYLTSTIELFSELQNKSTKNSISSLQLVTTIGVVAGIFGYLTKETPPQFTFVGFSYFLILLAITWLINTAVSKIYKNKRYTIRTSEIEKHIQ